MREIVRWLTRYVTLLGVLALPGAGCSAENDSSTTDAATTSSSTATTGPVVFVAEAKAMTFGNKDLAAASDRDLLGAREGGMRRPRHRGPGRGPGHPATRAVGGTPATTEARAFVRSAVRNVCPAHARAID